MSAIELRQVGVELGGRRVVDDVSVTLARGELLGLIGPNGAGKSSLLKAVAQLLPGDGAVRIDGVELQSLSPRQRARRLAYLGQGDRTGWPLTLRDFVALGRMPHRSGWLPARLSASDERAVDTAIARVHLQALQTRRLDQLSGGERARARLARALAVEAPLLLADEPVASLDPFHQLNVMELLRTQCALGTTVIVVLHDLTLASRFCDRVLLLDRGRAVACGDTRSVLTPKHLQQVYQVQAMVGEHQQQPFVVPWRCQPLATEQPAQVSP